jgi:hypothetical protein
MELTEEIDRLLSVERTRTRQERLPAFEQRNGGGKAERHLRQIGWGDQDDPRQIDVYPRQFDTPMESEEQKEEEAANGFQRQTVILPVTGTETFKLTLEEKKNGGNCVTLAELVQLQTVNPDKDVQKEYDLCEKEYGQTPSYNDGAGRHQWRGGQA